MGPPRIGLALADAQSDWDLGNSAAMLTALALCHGPWTNTEMFVVSLAGHIVLLGGQLPSSSAVAMGGGLLGLQWCLHWWCMSRGIHMKGPWFPNGAVSCNEMINVIHLTGQSSVTLWQIGANSDLQ